MPFEPARRYWRGSEPELDVLARSIDRRRLLVGEAKWCASSAQGPIGASHVPGTSGMEVFPVLFVPEGTGGDNVIDARMVLEALR